MRRSLALILFVLAAFAGNAFAIGQARITGKVTDAVTKQPIPNATITVVAVEAKTYRAENKVKKDGSYAIAVLDGTIKYKFTWAAEGYRPYEETMKLSLGEPNMKDVQLVPGSATVTASIPAGEIKIDPSVAAFNEGASLANEGKDAEALVKFQEAVAAKPDLQAGWTAIAKVQLRAKSYPKAIEAANKALALDSDTPDMYVILYDAYTATGDKAKAAEAKAKMPANASVLFNDAARAINAGKDGDAEPLLKQAIAADDTFAAAHYELGMLYVRTGKNADAKEQLEKYLSLDPSGRDAATAKEMLKYVK
jgi:ferric enterobactin receptor